MGWKCYYEHQSICFHQISGSTKTQIKSDLIKKIYYRNRFIFHKIHLNRFQSMGVAGLLVLSGRITQAYSWKIMDDGKL